jgi:SPP1 gp7 family putative phage head morphogenesis protein
MAQAVARFEAVAGEVNAQMRYALERLLKADGDLTPEDIEDAVQRVSRVAVTSTLEARRMALATANTVDKFNRRDVRRTIGIDVPEFSAPLGERWRREHIALIRSIPEEAKQRFTGLLRDASKKQTRVETIARALEENEGITHRRARLIARDQVLTLNAKLNRDRHKQAGIEEYVWHTVRDGSVRSNHSHLHGKKFRYDDDPPIGGGTREDEPGNPGDGIGCRCQAIPVVPEFEAKKPSEPKEVPKPPKPPKPPEPRKVSAPAPQPFNPTPLQPAELKELATALERDLGSLVTKRIGSGLAAASNNKTLRPKFQSRMRQHGFTFDRPSKGIFTNPSNRNLGGAHVHPDAKLYGYIELGANVAENASEALRLAKATGDWEAAHDHVATIVHEETHMAASVNARVYAHPEQMWIEEATTELAAQRITSQWLGTAPLKIHPAKAEFSRGVAYRQTILTTLDIASDVLKVTKAEALELVTEAGLAMRRPGSQTRTYLQAFLDGLPDSVTQAQKDALTQRIQTAAAAKVPTGSRIAVLDARTANTRSWSAPLFAILQEGGYPTDKQIDDAVRLSGAKTATSGEVHHLCMMLDSESVYAALSKHGIKVVNDGNKYR